jgi:hypothetical protein
MRSSAYEYGFGKFSYLNHLAIMQTYSAFTNILESHQQLAGLHLAVFYLMRFFEVNDHLNCYRMVTTA